MTNRRLLRNGLIAIALLVAVLVAGIYRFTEYEPPAATPSARVPSSRAPAAASPGASPESASGTAPQEEAPARALSVPPPPVLTTGELLHVPTARAGERQAAGWRRRQALGAIRDDLSAGFAALQERIARCGAHGASFVLSLEPTEGAVRVDAARLESRGGAPDEAVACASSALAGQLIPTHGTLPSRRWEAPLAAP